MSNAFFQVVRKWKRMFNGTSILHMEQGPGRNYEKGAIKGYYSDLRHKVQGKTDDAGIPYNVTNYGDRIYFCIAIFQYGLGSYDLYIETQNHVYLDGFKRTADWAMNNQSPNGSWDAFSFSGSDAPYSAMAQSEGASLLLRAYLEYREEKYLSSAKKAIDFMLTPIEKGGTAEYSGDKLTLLEYTDQSLILNGWIFSIWGLYEYTLVAPEEKYLILLEKTIRTLQEELPRFDHKYWSNYDLESHITSPFYHNLHIAQLEVMYQLFSLDVCKQYAKIWKGYSFRNWNRYRAIIKKGIQKLGSVKHTIILVE